jgi:hypothetical protein
MSGGTLSVDMQTSASWEEVKTVSLTDGSAFRIAACKSSMSSLSSSIMVMSLDTELFLGTNVATGPAGIQRRTSRTIVFSDDFRHQTGDRPLRFKYPGNFYWGDVNLNAYICSIRTIPTILFPFSRFICLDEPFSHDGLVRSYYSPTILHASTQNQ